MCALLSLPICLCLRQLYVCSCSSPLAVLRFIPTFFKSALGVLKKQVLGLACLALGMLFTVKSSAF